MFDVLAELRSHLEELMEELVAQQVADRLQEQQQLVLSQQAVPAGMVLDTDGAPAEEVPEVQQQQQLPQQLQVRVTAWRLEDVRKGFKTK
jgi:hypothetical protein